MATTMWRRRRRWSFSHAIAAADHRPQLASCCRRHLSSFLDPPPHPSPPPPQNPPDSENPDPATLREQWRYAIGLYSRWYSHAWGTTILAGLSFFAIGWFVKGENPLNTSTGSEPSPSHQDPPALAPSPGLVEKS